MSKIAYFFPGQGSQYVGMGKDLYEKSPAAKAVFDRADRVLGFSLSRLCFEGPEDELKKTENTQPALLTMGIACYAAAKELLPKPSYMAGHSLGEYTALTVAGALDFATAVNLTRERGRLMFEAGLKAPGTMAAVIAMDEDDLQQLCEETGVYIANLNCPGQIAISGEKEKIKEASRLAKQRGAKLVIPLQVSGAFHSPLMKSAADRLALQITSASVLSPTIPVISNTEALPLTTADNVRNELTKQVCSCVRWEDSIRYMLSQGVDTFIEIGPGNVLTGLLKRIAPEAKHLNIGKIEDIEGLKV